MREIWARGAIRQDGRERNRDGKSSSYFCPVRTTQLSRVRYEHRGVNDQEPRMRPSSWACLFAETLKMLVLLLLLAPSLLLRLQRCLMIVAMRTWLRVCMELWCSIDIYLDPIT